MKLRICLAQINTTVGDLAGNRQKVLDTLAAARKKRAQLVVFPELTLTGYPPEDLLFQGRFISENVRTLHSILPHTKDLALILGFVDRDKQKRLFNSAAFIKNKKIIHVYHKVELPNYGVFDEKRYFSPGDKNEARLWFGASQIGLTICEDIWQKNGFAYQRDYCAGLSFLINISASPFHREKHREREALVKNLAMKTGVPVVYLNLVGGQDELVFDGGSLVVDRFGRIVAQAKRFKEDLLTVDSTLKKPASFSTPSSKRPRVLSQTEEIYEALLLGTRDYIQKNQFQKVLIGLSGGIDSALVARIAVDALGAQNVLGVMMPSRYTSRETYEDSKTLAARLEIECLEFGIDKILDGYLETLKDAFQGRSLDTTEENLQARIRGNILMALSNKFGYLVLTTGNKSEMATGYCTLYGDMAGGFAVIKDVPKTWVFKLARYRNTLSPKNSISLSILKRPPSAELKPNQKDEDTLPPYAILDRFLELYVEKDLSVRESVRKGISLSTAKEVKRMVDRNEYKRRQAPPGIKITPKAFGRDRRMPITNRYLD